MCEPATLTTIAAYAAVAGAAATAYGTYQQSQTTKKIASNNAVVAGYKAEDAVRRGDEETQRVQRLTNQLAGTQRNQLAAKGLDLGVGTPGDTLEQTDFFGQQDAATARLNGRREAWGARAGQSNYQAQANATNPGMNAGLTLLSSSGSVADKWYTYRRG